ncbi:MAG: hypothetical protein HRU04_12995 [Oceanospirillaceae bacterium]|nr:hypothetical protein [Oceanospirillaceae bacterium]
MIHFFSGWINSLNGRLVFFWLIGSLVPVALLGGATAYISYYYVREQAIHFASEMVKEKAKSMINLQKPIVSVSNHIASDSNMLDVLFEDTSVSSISKIRVNALIEDSLAQYFSLDGLTAISLILNEGRSYSLSIEVEVTSIDLLLFQSQVESCPQLSESQLCWPGIQSNINKKSLHKQVIPAIKKIYRLNEETMQEEQIGYLYLAFSTHSYRKMLKQESTNNMPLLVLDQTNRVIFHDVPAMTGLAVASNMLPPKDDVPHYTQINGEPFFLVSHTSNISGWRFIIMVPEKQIMQGIYQTLFIASGLILLSLIFILFAWINVRRRVLKPLQALSSAMQNKERSISGYDEKKYELKEIHTLFYWYNKYVEIVEHRDQQAIHLREAYDELKLTQDQLIESEKMAALGKLVAGVAHEINTPLGVSLTSLTHIKEMYQDMEKLFLQNTLKRTDLERFFSGNQRGIDISINNLDRVSKLVNTFKTVATDQHVEELQSISFAQFLKNTLISLEPNLKKKNIAIKWECDEELVLCSYPGILWQVFSNLIMNSLIHGYANADIGTINIAVQLNGNVVTIAYSDDGCGMSDDVRESIFLPFFTTKRHSGGIGLGMHIVYNMVAHKLKGSIICRSEVDAGTEFIIRLPLETKLLDKDDSSSGPIQPLQ